MRTHSKILTALTVFFFTIINSQNFTEKHLLNIWSITDKTQTIEALKTYDDLKNNYNTQKFKELIKNLNRNSKLKNDLRLQVRYVLYQSNAEVLLTEKLGSQLKNELKNCIKSALILNDEQLLSEIYSLYYEQGFGDANEKLYYISKTVETQESIGAEYFPNLFFRYYNLSLGYYRSQDYSGSIQKGIKGLNLLASPNNHLDYYCFLLDILGTSYYEVGKYEKSLAYYFKLQKTLSEYRKNPRNYKGRFAAYDREFDEIWYGIADGGIARVDIQNKDYAKANQLLLQNLKTSQKYNLDDDIAKVYNLLGDLHFSQKKFSKAIESYQQSLNHSKKIHDSKNIIKSLLALSNTYRDLQQFEEAYLYSTQYYKQKSDLEQQISNRKYSIISEKLNQEDLKNSVEKAQATIKKQQVSRNTNFLIFTVIILGLGIFGAISYFQQKLKFSISENKRLNAEIDLEESKREAQIAEVQLQKLRQKLAENTKVIEALETDSQQQNSIGLQQLKQTTILTNEDWNEFKKQFEKAYPHFLGNLRQQYSELSQAELRYLCLAKLGLSSSEIASALGVSPASLRVTKHRIRKKIGTESDAFLASLL